MSFRSRIEPIDVLAICVVIAATTVVTLLIRHH
ncbi:hypothetical protein ACVWXU_004309 [Streptomyces sp. TE33382]